MGFLCKKVEMKSYSRILPVKKLNDSKKNGKQDAFLNWPCGHRNKQATHVEITQTKMILFNKEGVLSEISV